MIGALHLPYFTGAIGLGDGKTPSKAFESEMKTMGPWSGTLAPLYRVRPILLKPTQTNPETGEGPNSGPKLGVYMT